MAVGSGVQPNRRVATTLPPLLLSQVGPGSEFRLLCVVGSENKVATGSTNAQLAPFHL